MGGRSRGPRECAGGEGASGWWWWSARRARVLAVSTAWCVVQTTASKPRAPLRWRRRSEATRRCRRSTSAVCRLPARVHSAGMGGRSRGISRVRGRGGRERLVGAVGAGSAHGVLRGAGNSIHVEGAVALAAALKGNTTLQTLVLGSMWTARTRAFCGNRLLCGERRYVRRSRACICGSGVHVWGPRESASGETRADGVA